MTDTAEPSMEAALVDLTDDMRREIDPTDLRSGKWFTKLIPIYLRRHARRPLPAVVPAEQRRRAERAILRAAGASAATGAGAAGLTTSASVLTAESGLLAGVLAVPLAALGIGADMLLRAILHLRMTCVLGDLHGVRFDPDDPIELSQLFAVAFGTEQHEDPDDAGADLVGRVVQLDHQHSSQPIGNRMLTDSIGRDAIPVLGIALSALSSYRLTRRVGATVATYLRNRQALKQAFARAEREAQVTTELLIEGAWCTFVSDGRLTREEASLLAHLVGTRSPEAQELLLGRFVATDRDFLRRVGELADRPQAARRAVLGALEAAASVGAKISDPERAFLRRVEETLGLLPSAPEAQPGA